jgi:hypothetical protein
VADICNLVAQFSKVDKRLKQIWINGCFDRYCLRGASGGGCIGDAQQIALTFTEERVNVLATQSSEFRVRNWGEQQLSHVRAFRWRHVVN